MCALIEEVLGCMALKKKVLHAKDAASAAAAMWPWDCCRLFVAWAFAS